MLREDSERICVKYGVSVRLRHIHFEREAVIPAAREFRPGERRIFAKSRRFQARISAQPPLFHGKMTRGGGG